MGRSFGYTGSTETFVVPPHVPGSLRIHVHGAAGGNSTPYVGSQWGGGGGCVQGSVDLAEGTVLTIAVGGDGSNNSGSAGGAGGLNPLAGYDGGPGSLGWAQGGGGGGAASVVLADGVPIMVAGGGGGAVIGPYSNGRSGGCGGYSGTLSTTWFGARIPAGGQSSFNAQNGWGATWSGPGAGGAGNTSWPGAPYVGFPGSGTTGGGGSLGSGKGAGGGGGGYFGGGGGGQAGNQSGAGGGGSTWFDATLVSDLSSPDQSSISGSGGQHAVVISWRGIDGPNLGDCYAVSRTVNTNATSELYLNDNATTAAAFPTKTFTPSGLPAPGTVLSGFQLHLSTVTALGNGPHLRVLDPTGSTGISGTWSGPSGVPGGTGDITLDAWDYWVTEYLTWSGGAASSNDVWTTVDNYSGINEIDLIVRCRAADWDAGITGFAATIARFNGSSVSWEVGRHSTGLRVVAPTNGQTAAACTFYVPWASLGVVDGQWRWLRVHTVGNTTDVYDSADGVNWTLAQSSSVPGSVLDGVSGSLIVGNGDNASGYYGSGFNGSISDLFFGTDVGADASLNLVAMTASGDTSWPTTGGGNWTRTTSVTATGSALGSGNPTFWFDTPIALDQFAVFLDNTTAGSYRIDEWCLIYPEVTNKVAVGMLVAN